MNGLRRLHAPQNTAMLELYSAQLQSPPTPR